MDRLEAYWKKKSLINQVRNTTLTEKRRFGRKNEVMTIFASFDMHNDFSMSSRTRIVAVAVKAIKGISNFRHFKFSALKLSLNMDNRLSCTRRDW